MRRAASSSILAALALALAACGPVNRGLESVNQPVVKRADYVFDASADGLRATSPEEAQRLSAWFDALELSYGDTVTISDPAYYGETGARDAVAAILANRGMLLSREPAPVTEGATTQGNVRVVVSRSSATVPNCPNWDRQSQPEFASSTMSNYGCAVNSNLAAMVANPEDLVRGRSSDGNDPRTVSKAIKTYRDAAPTGTQGLKQESTKGSN